MKKFVAVAALCALLAACGGGDTNIGSAAPVEDGIPRSVLRPTVYTPDGRILNSCSLDPRCAGSMTLPGSYTSYSVARGVTGYVLTASDGAVTPIPSNLVRVLFNDGAFAFDLDGNAGQIYRLYQAAFNRKPDLVGLGLWIDRIDSGVPLLDIANSFYQSAEFKSLYGTQPLYTDLVTRFYRNALHREPDSAGHQYWVTLLNTGVLTPAQVLVQFSESPENKARVLNDIQNGITYIPANLQTPPASGFYANVTTAPANNAVVNGTVRLEVRGRELANVELLPASGYTPRLGVFNVSADRTLAWLDLDTKTLPNGLIDVRISAFNVPAGDPNGTEIVAMPARRWEIRNDTSAPPAAFGGSYTIGPGPGETISGTVRLEVRGNALANVELLPASGYTPRLGVFNISADKTWAWLDFDTRGLPDGPLDVRISAFNVPAGENGSEIVVMSPRRWEIRNGSAPPPASFSATVTMAPAHGAIVSGIARLEVRGSAIQNVELLPSSGYTPIMGRFTVSADRTLAWLDFDTRTWPDGPLDVRISAFSLPAGQPNAAELMAMPPRRWVIRN